MDRPFPSANFAPRSSSKLKSTANSAMRQSNTHANSPNSFALASASVPHLESSSSQQLFNDQQQREIDHRSLSSPQRQLPAQRVNQGIDREALLGTRRISQTALPQASSAHIEGQVLSYNRATAPQQLPSSARNDQGLSVYNQKRVGQPGGPMQLSALNVLHGNVSSAPSMNPTASGPMATSNSVQGGAYSQSAHYNQMQFPQQQLPQGTGNGIPNGTTNVSVSGGNQLQSHTGLHQQGLPGAHTHMQNYTNTGSISNDNILPASVVNDPSGAASNQFPGQGDALQNNNPWSDTHGGMPSNRYRVPQTYAQQHAIPHRQQNGMLPSFGNARNGAPGASSMAMPNTGLHSNINGHGVLGQMGAPLTNMNGLQQGTALGASQAMVPIGIGQQYTETDGAAGGRSYGHGQIDVMGNSMRGGKIGRPYEHHNTGFSHSIGNITAVHGLSDLPVQNMDPTFNAGVKTEDSSACGPRRSRPRKRGNKPPGAPSIPVHLRNPKKGRARVFRKCLYCNHDNHIRRSTCDNCKQALPAGKRRRDGNLSFQRENAAKQRSMATAQAATATPAPPFTSGTAQAPQPPRNGPAIPMPLQRPTDVNGPN